MNDNVQYTYIRVHIATYMYIVMVLQLSVLLGLTPEYPTEIKLIKCATSAP